MEVENTYKREREKFLQQQALQGIDGQEKTGISSKWLR
jgi:hypothetical protein